MQQPDFNTVNRYRCVNCSGYAWKAQCTRGEGHRTLRHIPRLVSHQAEARQRLPSEQGVALRRRRLWEVETPFAMMKKNLGVYPAASAGLGQGDAGSGLPDDGLESDSIAPLETGRGKRLTEDRGRVPPQLRVSCEEKQVRRHRPASEGPAPGSRRSRIGRLSSGEHFSSRLNLQIWKSSSAFLIQPLSRPARRLRPRGPKVVG
jgi:hypothetical protein